MGRRRVILHHLAEQSQRESRGRQLKHRGMLKGTQPLPHHRSGGNPAPYAAAEIAERLGSPMDAAEFHGPGGRPRIQASFAEALQGTAQISSGNAERQQVRAAGQPATRQAENYGDFSPAAIGQGAGQEARRQRHEGEDADHKADGLVRTAKVVTDVRRQPRQHGSNTQES